LVRHLRINAAERAVDRAIAFSAFDALKDQERSHGFREHSARSRRPFFRAGRADQWRSVLDATQVAAIVGAHEAEMARFGYLPPGS
ncbi:MAG: sulfotransferase domain-containing protein, partial [Alphaproteobacteria bacterium]